MNPKHYQHASVYMDFETFPFLGSKFIPPGKYHARMSLKVCRRKWRMTYGWRNNPAKAALHFTASSMFAECAGQAQKLADRLPIFKFKVVEAQVKSMFESAAGLEALCDKWVRVGSKHKWIVK